jgi:hypothetical protein
MSAIRNSTSLVSPAAASSRRRCAASPCAPRSTPRKRRRPCAAIAMSTLTRWPAKRSKSDRRTSGRSIPGEEISSRYAFSSGSATSRTGDRARETVSQSSIVMLPSGRSAMICTVQPARPEIRTRTSRKPRLSSTGSTSAAKRAATPCSTIRRGSEAGCKSGISLIRSLIGSFVVVVSARPSCLCSRLLSALLCSVVVVPGPVTGPNGRAAAKQDRGNKKERAPGGTHSQKPTGSNPIVMRCRLGQYVHGRRREYSDFTAPCKAGQRQVFQRLGPASRHRARRIATAGRGFGGPRRLRSASDPGARGAPSRGILGIWSASD